MQQFSCERALLSILFKWVVFKTTILALKCFSAKKCKILSWKIHGVFACVAGFIVICDWYGIFTTRASRRWRHLKSGNSISKLTCSPIDLLKTFFLSFIQAVFEANAKKWSSKPVLIWAKLCFMDFGMTCWGLGSPKKENRNHVGNRKSFFLLPKISHFL